MLTDAEIDGLPTSRGEEIRHWDDIGYTAVLEAKDDYARVVADFRVYEIVCTEVNEKRGDLWLSYPRGYQRQGATSSPDPVGDLANAEVFLHGSVKWDGCSDWHFDTQDTCMMHFCDKEGAEAIGTLLGRLYDWARELGMDRL